MFNPWISRQSKNPKINGISERSKTIKKRHAKPAKVFEEGEADGVVSDEDQAIEDNERAPSPLLGQFEKFPEYIEIELRPKPADFDALLAPFNKYALANLLDLKARELIYLKSFPITIKICLVPELNVLTISKDSGDITVDQLFANLVDYNDEGKQLQFRESASIISGSHERLFRWLHSYAGLHLATLTPRSLEQVVFSTEQHAATNLTSRDLFSKIIQRATSRSILNWQSDRLVYIVNEMPTIF